MCIILKIVRKETYDYYQYGWQELLLQSGKHCLMDRSSTPMILNVVPPRIVEIRNVIVDLDEQIEEELKNENSDT